MALLVHENGEIIDDIYLNVTEAKDNVTKGNKYMHKAKDHHKSAKKKKCCILLILLIVGVAIVVPTVIL